MKLVNTSDAPQEVKLDFKGLKKKFETAMVTSFHADEKAENTLDNPNQVKPTETTLKFDGTVTPTVTIPAKTFNVYRF